MRSIAVAILFICSPLMAQTVSFAPAGPNTNPAIAIDAAATSTASTATTTTTPVTTASPGINNDANTGQNSQNSGSGANAAAAAALMAAAMPLMMNPTTVPMGAALMAMGMLAAMQAGADSDAAGQSAATGAAATNTSPSTTNPALTTTPYSAGSSSVGYATNPATSTAAQTLAAAGYSVTPTTITTPSGTFPTSSLNSESGLAAAGLDPKALAAAQKIAADAIGDNGPKVSGLGLSEGSGGAAANGNRSLASELQGLQFSDPFGKLDASKRKALIEGKTVNFDGEPIGVRGADIFEMVHTAYNKQTQRGNFIGVAADTVRSPASVSPIVPATVISPAIPAANAK